MKDALRLPAVVRFSCSVIREGPYCKVANGVVTPTATLNIEAPFGKTVFQVERARSTVPVEAVPIEVRLAGLPSALSLIKAGDVDLSGTTNELALLARVASVEPVRTTGPSGAEVTVSLIAQMQKVEQQWLYDSTPLRVGAPITLRTSRYQATGVVTRMPQPDSSASK